MLYHSCEVMNTEIQKSCRDFILRRFDYISYSLNWYLQDFINLIQMIAALLEGLVTNDPTLIAYDIANFERELSFVSV